MKAARCPNDNEVVIFFDDSKKHYADLEEHVPDKVDFYAGSRCTLFFEENTKVFEKDKYLLNEGDNWLTPKGPGRTAYAIDRRPKPKTEGMSGDPIVVVP